MIVSGSVQIAPKSAHDHEVTNAGTLEGRRAGFVSATCDALAHFRDRWYTLSRLAVCVDRTGSRLGRWAQIVDNFVGHF